MWRLRVALGAAAAPALVDAVAWTTGALTRYTIGANNAIPSTPWGSADLVWGVETELTGTAAACDTFTQGGSAATAGQLGGSASVDAETTLLTTGAGAFGLLLAPNGADGFLEQSDAQASAWADGKCALTKMTLVTAATESGATIKGGQYELSSGCDGTLAVTSAAADKGVHADNDCGVGLPQAVKLFTTGLSTAAGLGSMFAVDGTATTEVAGTGVPDVYTVAIHSITTLKDGDEHVVSGGFRLTASLTCTGTSGVCAAHDSGAIGADPTTSASPYYITAGATAAHTAGANSDVVASFTTYLRVNLKHADTLSYMFGSTNPVTVAHLTTSADGAAIFSQKTDAADVTPVTMQFATNAQRMHAYYVLKHVANVKLDGATETTETAPHFGGNAVTDNNVTTITAPVIDGQWGGYSLTMECDAVRSGSSAWATGLALKQEVLREIYNAGVAPFSLEVTLAAQAFTAVVWSDEELYAVQRRLFVARGSVTCLRWKPTQIKCKNCNPELAAGTAFTPTTYTVKMQNVYSAEFVDGTLDAHASYQSGGDPRTADAATVACEKAESLVLAQLVGRNRANSRNVHGLTYCKPGAAGGVSETIEIAFGDTEDAAWGLDGILVASGVDSANDGTTDDYHTLTSTADLFSITYKLTAASTATASTASDAGTVAASTGGLNEGTSACSQWNAKAATAETLAFKPDPSTTPKLVYCTSAAAGTGNMVMYFTSKKARAKKAQELARVLSTDLPTHLISIEPTAQSHGTLRVVTFKATNRGGTDGSDDNQTATWEKDSHVASPAAYEFTASATTACQVAMGSADKAVGCASKRGTGTDMVVTWLGDDRTLTTSEDADARGDIRTLVAVEYGTPSTPSAVTIGVWNAFEWKDTTQLYTIDYDVTKMTDTTPVASTGNFATADSPCAFAVESNVVYCVSTATTMTIGWLYAVGRQTDARLIGDKSAADPIQSLVPTAALDAGTDTTWAEGGVGFTKVVFRAQNASGAAAWALADHKLTTDTSACKEATESAAENTGAKDAIYCDSGKTSGSDLTLIWLSTANAKTDMKELANLEKGTAKTADDASTLVPLAEPKTGQFYTTSYTVHPFTATTPAPLKLGFIDAGTKSSGCSHATAGSNWVACTQTSATAVTLHFVSQADRTSDGNAIAKAAEQSPVSSLEPTAVSDKGTPGAFATLVYKATDAESKDWASETKILGATGSACVGVADLTKAIFCSSGKAAGSDMTLKWVDEAVKEAVDGAETDVWNYIADARAVAGKANTIDPKQRYVLKADSAGAAGSLIVVSYGVAAITTTVAPTARMLAGLGSTTSTGGFGAADSYCQAMGTAAGHAIFCDDSTSGTVKLSYLSSAMAATDTATLQASTAAYMSLKSDEKITISVTAGAAEIAKDSLCAALSDPLKGNILNVAICSHARIAASASGDVTLTFITKADKDAAATAAKNIDWGAFFTMVSGAPSVTGGSSPTPSPSPSTPAGGPSTGNTPSGAALRLVGFAFLAVFAAA